MEVTTLCAVVAALSVLPNRSQFFQYESVSLSCKLQGNSSGWRVRRTTIKNTTEDCPSSWNRRNEPHCIMGDLYTGDSGVYWCESAAGGCSNTVSITVTAGPVILQSPVLPVMEGAAVTLSCTNRRTSSSSNLTTRFYKDELLVGSSSTGNFTIHSVSRADEGLYRCSVSGAGESPDSRLTVRGRPAPPDSSLAHILLPVVGVCLLLIVLLLCLWRTHKGKVKPAVSYTDVTITQGVKPQRISDVDAVPTFYSTVKLETT